MFVTTLEMDNFDCTKITALLKKIHTLSMGGAHSRVEACIGHMLLHMGNVTIMHFVYIECILCMNVCWMLLSNQMFK